MLFTLLIVLAQALAIVQAGLFSKPGDDAAALCAGKSIDLVSLKQLKTLDRDAPLVIDVCPSEIESAVYQLRKLIEDNKDDLCSASSVESFKRFYAEQLDTSADSEKKEKELPSSLKNFAIAYGMEISSRCKQNMVDVLVAKESDELLSGQDFEQFEELINDESPVAQILSSSADPGDVIMPGDMAPFIKRSGANQEELFLQTSNSSYIKNLQTICERRFKPVYEPLIMPIVRLANIGFNYKDDSLSDARDSTTVAKQVSRWSRIVFMCEALMGVRVVDDDKVVKKLADEADAGVVRILTKEEAAAIDPESSAHDESDDDKELAYKPTQARRVTIGDLIYDKSNAKLNKAIKSLKTSRSEEDIIRSRMASVGYALMKGQMKRGNFGLVVSSGFKRLFGKSNSPTEEVVKNLNETEHEIENEEPRKINPVLGVIYFLIVFSVESTRGLMRTFG